MKLHYVPDIVESNGKTIRENNMLLQHNITLGTLVEVNIDYSDHHGIRAFVVRYDRDCDGTPLYGLGMSNDLASYECSDKTIQKLINMKIESGFPEDSLVIVK